MSRASPIQTSFNGGEWSPRLEGRVDLDRYATSLRRMENMMPLVQGNATKRPGTRFVKGAILDSGEDTKESRLIPFIFDRDQAYALEFGDLKVRFFRNDATTGEPGIVLEDAVSVTSNTAADPSTITTTAPHYYTTGDEVFIEGTGEPLLDGRFFVVTVTGANTFTVDPSAAPGANTGGTVKRIHEVASPYVGTPGAVGDVDRLKYEQSADVMYLTHEDVYPHTLTRIRDNYWILAEADVEFEPFRPTNLDERFGPHVTVGTVTRGSAVTVVSKPEISITAMTAARPCQCTVANTEFLETGDELALYSTAWTSLNNLTFRITVTSTTTFTLDESDTLAEATPQTALAGHAIFKDSGLFDVFAMSELISAEHPEWREYDDMGRHYGRILTDAGPDTGVGVFECRYDENVYLLASNIIPVAPGTSAVTGTSPPVHRKGYEIDGRMTWQYLHSGTGYVRVVTKTNDALITATVEKRLPKSMLGDSPIQFRFAIGAWGSITGHPNAVTFFEDRLWFGGTAKDPLRFWGSKQSQYLDFERLESDESAIAFTLNSKHQNTIEWLVGGRQLQIGTSGAETVVSAVSETEALTQANVRAVTNATFGSKANVEPLPVDNVVIFAQRAGRKLREFVFAADDESYKAPDLTALAEHLTLPGVRRMAYAQEPNKLIWAAMDDGSLACLTYERENDVVAWHRHALGGRYSLANQAGSMGATGNRSGEGWVAFTADTSVLKVGMSISVFSSGDVALAFEPALILEILDETKLVISSSNQGDSGLCTWAYAKAPEVLDIAAIPDPTLNRDQLWLLVRRTINGVTRNYVESLEQEWDRGDPLYTARFLETSLTREGGVGTATVDGLDHLIGEEVTILADGKIYTDTVAADGGVTIAVISHTWHVGLPFDARLALQRQEGGAQDGTSQGKAKRIQDIVLRLDETGEGLYYGPTFDRTTQNEYIIAAQTLFSGDTERLLWPDGYGMDGFITLEHRAPTPFTLSAVMPHLATQDGG